MNDDPITIYRSGALAAGVSLRKNLRKHYAGCYRARLDDEQFVQLRRVKRRADGTYEPQTDGRHWSVEVRVTATGDLVRYGGVWESLDEARKQSGAPAFVPLGSTIG